MHADVYLSNCYGGKVVKQPRCPSLGEQIDKMWYMHTVDYKAALESKLGLHENWNTSLKNSVKRTKEQLVYILT